MTGVSNDVTGVSSTLTGVSNDVTRIPSTLTGVSNDVINIINSVANSNRVPTSCQDILDTCPECMHHCIWSHYRR